jgi:hypothetical protein
VIDSGICLFLSAVKEFSLTNALNRLFELVADVEPMSGSRSPSTDIRPLFSCPLTISPRWKETLDIFSDPGSIADLRRPGLWPAVVGSARPRRWRFSWRSDGAARTALRE